MNTTIDFATTPVPAPISTISTEEYQLIMTALVLAYINPVMVSFDIVTNIINIVVFLKSGAKDNVTMLQLALAMSDITFLCFSSTRVIGFVLFWIVKLTHWPFDFTLFTFLLYWPALTAYNLSCYIAVSLGVIRCAWVSMPLKFKMVFTKSRTVKWAIFLVFLAVAIELPTLLINRVAWRTDPVTNVTTPYMLRWNIAYMLQIHNILNRGIIYTTSYTTMIVCVIDLSVKLYQASKIRQSSISTSYQSYDQASEQSAVSKLSSRDLQVVKYVALVYLIFVLAQLPAFFSGLFGIVNTYQIRDEIFIFLASINSQVSMSCYYLNASVNIFIHYRYNNKYKTVFLSLFKGARK